MCKDEILEKKKFNKKSIKIEYNDSIIRMNSWNTNLWITGLSDTHSS